METTTLEGVAAVSVTEQPARAGVTEQLASARAALAALAGTDLHDLAGQELVDSVDVLEAITRQVESLTTRALATVEASGVWALDGARSMAAWYRHRTGRSARTATTKVAQARSLRDTLPATGAALGAGVLSPDHVTTLVRHATTTPKLRAQLDDPELGEAWLVTQGHHLDASAFTTLVRSWATRVDPDAADRTYVEEAGREEFFLSPTTGGYVPGGFLTTEHGKILDEAIRARIGTPGREDHRRPAQRRAEAITALARAVLDGGTLRPGARIRPHLAVHVPYDTLTRLITASAPTHRPGCPARPRSATGAPRAPGPTVPWPASGSAARAPRPGLVPGCTCHDSAHAVIDAALDTTTLTGAEPATLTDGTPLAPAQLARLVCDSQMHRVIFGPDNEVLNAGREERLFTAGQTRAIIARDRHCQYPGCDAPPGEGEIHHSAWWWAHHGATDVAGGLLACWHHHDYIHTHHIRAERHNGRWTFHRRDGTPIT